MSFPDRGAGVLPHVRRPVFEDCMRDGHRAVDRMRWQFYPKSDAAEKGQAALGSQVRIHPCEQRSGASAPSPWDDAVLHDRLAWCARMAFARYGCLAMRADTRFVRLHGATHASGETLFECVDAASVLMFGIVLVRCDSVIVGDMDILSIDRSRVSNCGLRAPLDAVLIDARSLSFGPLHWVDLEPARKRGEIDLITLTVSLDGANERSPEFIGDLM
ncbi:hypothetical protein WK56_19380 [Burkholderia ubonensis]|nr:hypothetical protein WK56_19380 [Burkholderia ubonensis]